MLAVSRALEPAARDAYVVMRIICRGCGKRMLIHVGLTLPPGPTGEAGHSVDCLDCGRRLLPLAPGPILDGPFAE